MTADVTVKRTDDKIRIQIELSVPDGTPMMECEELILDALNLAGNQATAEFLKRFDTDGSPIQVGNLKLTSKGEIFKKYQTPYGEIGLERHLYQSSEGGKTYCPLEESARVIQSTTPRFARMCSRKYASTKSTLAQEDLAESHGRKVSRCYLQDIAEAVGEIAQRKFERWRYVEPLLQAQVSKIGVGIDGTCVLFCEEGFRQPMVGTIALYDILGERLHTVYIAAPPESGKEAFFKRMEEEIAIYKERYPRTYWVGVADGARDYWPWLQEQSDKQVLDFFHAASYLEGAAAGMFSSRKQRELWFEESRHRLKEEPGAAAQLLEEMTEALEEPCCRGKARQSLERAVGYYSNHLSMMDYVHYRNMGLPIGSGVTEAACKTVVKERMCGSGMKWKQVGAATILNLRSLILSKGRWDQFWSKITRFGI
jgi:hypothetical protein